MTKFFVDASGNYLGGFDGAEPPAGAVEVSAPPPHGWMVLTNGAWVMPPDKQAILDAMGQP